MASANVPTGTTGGQKYERSGISRSFWTVNDAETCNSSTPRLPRGARPLGHRSYSFGVNSQVLREDDRRSIHSGCARCDRGGPYIDLRNKIRQLFKDKKPTSLEKNTLDALLGRAKRLSEKRHSYLHRAWSETDAGHAVVKGEDHLWEPAPSVSEVERVASEILTLGERLNHDRLHGFIRDVVLRQPPRQPHKL